MFERHELSRSFDGVPIIYWFYVIKIYPISSQLLFSFSYRLFLFQLAKSLSIFLVLVTKKITIVFSQLVI